MTSYAPYAPLKSVRLFIILPLSLCFALKSKAKSFNAFSLSVTVYLFQSQLLSAVLLLELFPLGVCLLELRPQFLQLVLQ